MPDFSEVLTIPATKHELENALNWADEFLTRHKCPREIINSILVICEEVFINIALYAYNNNIMDNPSATISLSICKEEQYIAMRFEDSGISFNPLEFSIPDTKTELGNRNIGGLGIFLVRKLSNTIQYERKNEKNILTVVKYFEGE